MKFLFDNTTHPHMYTHYSHLSFKKIIVQWLKELPESTVYSTTNIQYLLNKLNGKISWAHRLMFYIQGSIRLIYVTNRWWEDSMFVNDCLNYLWYACTSFYDLKTLIFFRVTNMVQVCWNYLTLGIFSVNCFHWA